MNKLLRFIEQDWCPFIIYWNIRRIVRFYKNIKTGIKNLIKWLPIIWRDRDWDHLFLTELLEAKIKFMRKSFADNQNYVGWEDAVKSMDEALKYLALINRPDYYGRNSDIQQEVLRRELFVLLEKELAKWWW